MRSPHITEIFPTEFRPAASFNVRLGWGGEWDVEILVNDVWVESPVYSDGKPVAIGNFVNPALAALKTRGIRLPVAMIDDVHFATAEEA
jgi:hypothetical protein